MPCATARRHSRAWFNSMMPTSAASTLAWVVGVRPTKCPSWLPSPPTTPATPCALGPARLRVSPPRRSPTGPACIWRLAADVRNDGLNCFAGVLAAGCAHCYVVVGARKPRDLPLFTWVNTVLGNLKTMISGAHKSFKFEIRQPLSRCLLLLLQPPHQPAPDSLQLDRPLRLLRSCARTRHPRDG